LEKSPHPKIRAEIFVITFNAADHPVWNGDHPVGMLTDRDLVVRAVADGRDPKGPTVEEIMTRLVACCFEDQDIEEAEQVMEKNQIHLLPVLDHDNRIVGIVSLGDLTIKDVSSKQLRRQ
jgi:CBS domain-containing protein